MYLGVCHFGQDFREDAEGLLGLFLLQIVGGEEADGGFLGDIQEQAFVHGFGDDGGGGDGEFDADHHAQDADLFDDGDVGGELLKAGFKPFRHIGDVREEAFFFDGFEGGEAGGHGEGVAAEGARVHAGAEAGGDFVFADEAATGDAAGDPFGEGHDIGLDAEVLVAEPGAEASAAGLDFVEDEDEAMFIGEVTEALEEAIGGDVDAAFALDGFDEEGAGFVVDEVGDGLEVAVGGVLEAGDEGADAFMIFWLGGGGHGAVGASVEAFVEGDDLVFFGWRVEAGELDGAFDSLSATVTEEGFAEAAGADRFGEEALLFGVPGVGDVDEMLGLFLNRGDQSGVGVAKDVTAPAGEEVEELSAFGVIDIRAFAADEADGVAFVIGDDVLVEEGDGFG